MAVEAADRRSSATNQADERFGTLAHDDLRTAATAKPREREIKLPTYPVPQDSCAQQATLVRPNAVIDTRADVNLAGSARPQGDENIVDVEVPQPPPSESPILPTLYVAVGGIGIRILCRLRDLLAHRANALQPSMAVEMIAIDTDRTEIKNACSTNWRSPLATDDALHLQLKLPQMYREQGSHLEWLSHRWLYNIPRSLETRGYRPLGRLAMVDHVDKVLTLLDRKLDQLAAVASGAADQLDTAEIRVVLLVGMGGGTGSGMVIDLANAVRSRLQASKRRGQVQGVLVCTCLGNTNASPLSVANAYALLTELQFVSAFGNQARHAQSASLPQLESPHRPFDLVYVAKALAGANHSVDEGLVSIAAQMALASTDGAGQILRCCQRTATPRELAGRDSLLLRTFAGASLAGPHQRRIDRLAKSLAHAMKQQWLTNASPSEWRRLEEAIQPRNVDEGSSLQNAVPECSNVAPLSSGCSFEEWRRSFGRHASTQFAYDALSRVCRPSSLRESGRKSILSSTQSAHFVELALQSITAISKCAADALKLGETLSDEDEFIVNKLAANSHGVLTEILDEIEQVAGDSSYDTAQTDRTVAKECFKAVEAFLGRSSADVAVDVNSRMQQEAEDALGKAAVDLLQCGYDRRTLIVVPESTRTSEAITALTNAQPDRHDCSGRRRRSGGFLRRFGH